MIFQSFILVALTEFILCVLLLFCCCYCLIPKKFDKTAICQYIFLCCVIVFSVYLNNYYEHCGEIYSAFTNSNPRKTNCPHVAASLLWQRSRSFCVCVYCFVCFFWVRLQLQHDWLFSILCIFRCIIFCFNRHFFFSCV